MVLLIVMISWMICGCSVHTPQSDSMCPIPEETSLEFVAQEAGENACSISFIIYSPVNASEYNFTLNHTLYRKVDSCSNNGSLVYSKPSGFMDFHSYEYNPKFDNWNLVNYLQMVICPTNLINNETIKETCDVGYTEVVFSYISPSIPTNTSMELFILDDDGDYYNLSNLTNDSFTLYMNDSRRG